MRLWSETIGEGEQVPERHTRDGDNLSPPLTWDEVPGEARELALLVENVTPETKEPFAQWLLYGIPVDGDGLPEGFRHKRDPEEPAAARQGTNDIGNVGYDGPQGSVGRAYRYRFRLLALDRPLELGPGANRADLLKAAADRTVAQAEFTARYERPR